MAEICAAILPLVGQEVRVTFLDSDVRALCEIWGCLHGSYDRDPADERRLALALGDQLVRVALSEVRAVRRYRFPGTAGRALHVVAVAYRDRSAIELEQDLLAALEP